MSRKRSIIVGSALGAVLQIVAIFLTIDFLTLLITVVSLLIYTVADKGHPLRNPKTLTFRILLVAVIIVELVWAVYVFILSRLFP
jgi:membrane-associated HD superfamily phosphohydrolase